MDCAKTTLKGIFYSVNKPTRTPKTLKNPDTIKKRSEINKQGMPRPQKIKRAVYKIIVQNEIKQPQKTPLVKTD